MIAGAAAMLCLLGLVMVLSATTVKSTNEYGTAWYYFRRQAGWLAAGMIALVLTLKVGHRRLRPLVPLGLATAVGGLLLVLVPTPISKGPVNGSRRWLSFGSTNLQPSEIAKLAVILWVAALLTERVSELHDWRRTILPIGVGTLAVAGLILAEPDLGTAVVLCTIVAAMLLVGGARLDVMGLAGAPVLVGLTFIAFTGYHAERWSFLDPLKDAGNTNYQLTGALSSVASGGWFGVGPGASTAKWGYLPEAHTDAVFAVIGEELGVVGCLAVVALYLALLGAGMRVARRVTDRFGSLVAIGITMWIGMQAFVNMGVTVGILPNKGFTLPFVSYGGSSLLVMLVATGVLLSIAKESA